MKIYFPIIFVSLLLVGCVSTVYRYDLKTGEVKKFHASSSEDAEFMDSVDEDIRLELTNAPLKYGTWREFWIDHCEQLHYWEPLGKDEPLIQYVINKRREAGLPDIPEIDKRQFRSQWQNWTDAVDEQLALESKGLPPLSMFDVKQRKMTKTWPEYWKAFEENILQYPSISTNGVEYIKNRRQTLGLKPFD